MMTGCKMFGMTFVKEFCTEIIQYWRGRVGQRNLKLLLDVWDSQGEASGN